MDNLSIIGELLRVMVHYMTIIDNDMARRAVHDAQVAATNALRKADGREPIPPIGPLPPDAAFGPMTATAV